RPLGAGAAGIDRARPGNRHSARAHQGPQACAGRVCAATAADTFRFARRPTGRAGIRLARPRAGDRRAPSASFRAGADVQRKIVPGPGRRRVRRFGNPRIVRELDSAIAMSESSESGAIRQVSIERLFADNHDRLGLVWLSGRQGGSRVLTGESSLKPTIGQIGHMNFIHPFRLQIIGAAEAAYLRALPEDALNASISRLFTTELVAIIVANGEEMPTHLLDECNKHHVAL